MTALTIDLVSDLVCPWCFIGKHRLEQALATLPDVDATVLFHPFQLDPSTPDEGVDLRQNLRSKYGRDPDEMFARVESVAHSVGIPLDFQKVRRTPNTLKAHTLLRHAQGRGTQGAMAEALFAAHFLRGLDIGRAQVLADVAADHGFAPDDVHAILSDPAELDQTRHHAAALAAQGIRSVPHFVLGGKVAVSGGQPLQVFRDAIAQAIA